MTDIFWRCNIWSWNKNGTYSEIMRDVYAYGTGWYYKKNYRKTDILKTQIELENVMHLFDNNIGLEDFTCGLMNLVYGYN